ncbi:MAG: hypothetical protein L6R38_004356 [Xanthoria sp. 2 TBL-2021]|nr:MAG: hypothetical protein L6R38_004356 [Xanthoria sp. 2 TBL-2021]
MRVRPQPNTRIDAIPMFYVAVEALATIALQGPRGRTPTVLFRLSRYPAVAIDLIPKYPATDMTNEVATLCIYYGIEDMARHRDYRESYLGCEWDHIEVATIRVWSPARSSRADQPQDGADDPSLGDTITNLTALLRTNLQPHFFYPYDASELDTTLVFITVMNALMRFSWMSIADPVGQCWIEPGPAWDASIVLSENNLPRSRPPILEVRWVLETLRLVPTHMRQSRRWAELGIVFQVDGIYLGNAKLQKGKPQQTVSPGSNAATTV